MTTEYFPNVATPVVGNSTSTFIGILSSTHATPIAITTTANGTTPGPHGMQTGDCVEVVGHEPNESANGAWQITVTGANTFTLNTSVGVAVGNRSGNVTQLAVDPSYTLPSDGEDVTASSVNTFAEGLANLAPWLYQRTGQYRLVDIYQANQITVKPWVNWAGTLGASNIAATNTPQQQSLGIFGILGGFGFNYTNPPGLLPGDMLDVEVTTGAVTIVSTGLTIPTWGLNLALGLMSNGGFEGYIEGTEQTLAPGGTSYTGTQYYSSLTLTAVVQAGGYAYDFDICMCASAITTASLGSDGLLVIPSGRCQIIVKHYRNNTLAP
jgi:hypothetical protein